MTQCFYNSIYSYLCYSLGRYSPLCGVNVVAPSQLEWASLRCFLVLGIVKTALRFIENLINQQDWIALSLHILRKNIYFICTTFINKHSYVNKRRCCGKAVFLKIFCFSFVRHQFALTLWGQQWSLGTPVRRVSQRHLLSTRMTVLLVNVLSLSVLI